MSKIKRISYWGGAGCGKSTMAARTFYELKVRGYEVEYVPEYIKVRAYQKRFPKSHEQVYIFGKQEHAEDDLMDHVQATISDSPLLMNAAYSERYGFRGSHHIIGLANLYEEDYPSLNFWVHRKHPYNPEGRYQTLEEALEIDDDIRRLMLKHLPPERVFFEDMEFEEMLAIMEAHLNAS